MRMSPHAEILCSGLTIVNSVNSLLTENGLLLERCYRMSAKVTAASHDFYQSLVALSDNWDMETPIQITNSHVRALLKEACHYAWDVARAASQADIDIRMLIGEAAPYSHYFWRMRSLDTTMQDINEMVRRTVDDLTHLCHTSAAYSAELETIKGWILPIYDAVQVNQKIARVTVESSDKVLLQAVAFIRATQYKG